MVKNFYEVLRVERTASKEEIDGAFALAKKAYLPFLSSVDLEEKKAALDILAELTEAHQTLSDPEARERYDKALEEETEAATMQAEEELGQALIEDRSVEVQAEEISLQSEEKEVSQEESVQQPPSTQVEDEESKGQAELQPTVVETPVQAGSRAQSPGSRLNRQPFIIANIVILLLHIFLIDKMCDGVIAAEIFRNDFGVFMLLVSFVADLAVAVVQLLLVIKRCHDLDRTALLSLLLFVPFVNILFLLYLCIEQGTLGNNRYGPDPLQSKNKINAPNVSQGTDPVGSVKEALLAVWLSVKELFNKSNSRAISLDPRFDKYFSGRLNRWRYFLYGLVQGIAAIAGLMIVGLFGELSDVLAGVVAIPIVILLIMYGISLFIRRLHDLNKSGWLCLIAFVPYVNMIFFLWLLFARGSYGDNKYGPDPLEQRMS